MDTLQAIALLFVFILITALMSKRIWPAMLAMPVLAVVITLIAGIDLQDIFKYVMGEGSVRLIEPIVISMFGGALSVLMQRTGIAENFIKKGAELSGDNPFVISISMLVLIMLLFTTLGGLGAMILVGSIVLPILTSVGIGRLTAAVIMLMGVNIGGMFNVGNWSLYMNSLGLSQYDVQRFVLIMICITFPGALIYIGIQLYRDGFDVSRRKIIRSLSVLVVIAAIVILIRQLSLNIDLSENFTGIITIVKKVLFFGLLGILLLLYLHSVFRAMKHRNKSTNPVHWTAIFTPIIPLLLILVFKINFIAAFILGIAYAYLVTYRRDSLSILLKSLIEGASIVLPAVILMFGIGWILVAVKGPDTIAASEMLAKYGTENWPVRELMVPFIEKIIPSKGWQYVLVFTVFAPLALYRGPLNVWGMGFGIASVLLAAGLPAGAILGMLWSVGQLQGICDPTNIQNVWIANEMKIDVQKILFNTLPYAWIFALLGLIAGAFIYF